MKIFTQKIKLAMPLLLLSLYPPAGCSGSPDTNAQSAATVVQEASEVDADQQLGQLEKEYDARLGIYAIDTETGRTVSYRPDERFAYTSTFKPLAAGALLLKKPLDELDKVITYKKEDLVTYSPVTEKHVEKGMTLREISDAAIRYSDNTAGNLLLKELGGPAGLETVLQEVGDHITKPERYETDLNEAVPGDIRDTSTPKALATTLKAFTVDGVLPAEKQDVLIDWLKRNTTGDELIRAAVPEGWTVGDKTGAGSYGTRNDIAVIWPPNQAPIVMAVLSSRTEQDATYDNALIAKAAKVVLDSLELQEEK
ncbi:beta-lactamase [Brevibacillus panacihumi W25]|uniref:Beta-lactamase n=1 Tax=Brevibacillus panacihumi W25 TaxID=1408254 RepID=V6M907_9BACL|nr:class A beta-lactamase [Brevibacillus panacihumi]EST55019.1 beta-lactamase [Brevibacillus panacihumi W25]